MISVADWVRKREGSLHEGRVPINVEPLSQTGPRFKPAAESVPGLFWDSGEFG
jgi:hypothetical protein